MKCKVPGLLLAFLFISVAAMAQDCGDGPGLPGQDVDLAANGCPLDTWVVLLAGAALIFTTIQLYRKQLLDKAI